MGLAAFNRMRRLQAEKEKKEQLPKFELENLEIETINEYTKDEIKARLDELQIEYKSNDNKEKLIKLLKGLSDDEDFDKEGEENGEQEGQSETGRQEGQTIEGEQTEENEEK